MFGSCEIQMPSSRRIFPLLGTSGHPFGLALLYLFIYFFPFQYVCLAHEFEMKTIQLFLILLYWNIRKESEQ